MSYADDDAAWKIWSLLDWSGSIISKAKRHASTLQQPRMSTLRRGRFSIELSACTVDKLSSFGAE